MKFIKIDDKFENELSGKIKIRNENEVEFANISSDEGNEFVPNKRKG